MERYSLEILKSLGEGIGPFGFEPQPVPMMKSYVQHSADELCADNLGSLHFSTKGNSTRPVVLSPDYEREVGFIICGANEHIGQVPLGRNVKIRCSPKTVPSLIAAKTPQILPVEDRSKVVIHDDMCIDIGCLNGKEARDMGVRISDPVVGDSSFSTIGRNAYRKANDGEEKKACGEAFDDRAGEFVAAESVHRPEECKISFQLFQTVTKGIDEKTVDSFAVI
jgi:putative aminopeptidase FrvX